MATNSPGGSTADHTGQASDPTYLEASSLRPVGEPPEPLPQRSIPAVTKTGRVAPGAHRTPYPQHHQSRPPKEMLP